MAEDIIWDESPPRKEDEEKSRADALMGDLSNLPVPTAKSIDLKAAPIAGAALDRLRKTPVMQGIDFEVPAPSGRGVAGAAGTAEPPAADDDEIIWDEPPPVAPPAPEEVGAVTNIVRGIGERGLELAGSTLDFATQVGANLGKDNGVLEGMGAVGDILGGGLVIDEKEGVSFRKRKEYNDYLKQRAAERPDEAPNFVSRGAKALKDASLGYVPGTTWEEVKESYDSGDDSVADTVAKAGGFALEQGLVSVPDMIGVMKNVPVYITSRAGEIARNRAEADGRDTVSPADLAIGAVTSVFAAAAERFGVQAMLAGLTRKAVGAAGRAGGAAAGAATGGLTEAGTEALQEGAEYLAETVGQENVRFNPADAGDRMLAGIVGGGGFGAGVGGVSGVAGAGAVQAANNVRTKIRERATRVELEQSLAELEATGPEGVAEAARLRIEAADLLGAPVTPSAPAAAGVRPAGAPILDVPDIGGGEFETDIPASEQAQAAEAQPTVDAMMAFAQENLPAAPPPAPPATPAAQKKATELGVPLVDVTPTGKNGRITVADVLKAKEAQPVAEGELAPAPPTTVEGVPIEPDEQVVVVEGDVPPAERSAEAVGQNVENLASRKVKGKQEQHKDSTYKASVDKLVTQALNKTSPGAAPSGATLADKISALDAVANLMSPELGTAYREAMTKAADPDLKVSERLKAVQEFNNQLVDEQYITEQSGKETEDAQVQLDRARVAADLIFEQGFKKDSPVIAGYGDWFNAVGQMATALDAAIKAKVARGIKPSQIPTDAQKTINDVRKYSNESRASKLVGDYEKLDALADKVSGLVPKGKPTKKRQAEIDKARAKVAERKAAAPKPKRKVRSKSQKAADERSERAVFKTIADKFVNETNAAQAAEDLKSFFVRNKVPVPERSAIVSKLIADRYQARGKVAATEGERREIQAAMEAQTPGIVAPAVEDEAEVFAEGIEAGVTEAGEAEPAAYEQPVPTSKTKAVFTEPLPKEPKFVGAQKLGKVRRKYKKEQAAETAVPKAESPVKTEYEQEVASLLGAMPASDQARPAQVARTREQFGVDGGIVEEQLPEYEVGPSGQIIGTVEEASAVQLNRAKQQSKRAKPSLSKSKATILNKLGFNRKGKSYFVTPENVRKFDHPFFKTIGEKAGEAAWAQGALNNLKSNGLLEKFWAAVDTYVEAAPTVSQVYQEGGEYKVKLSEDYGSAVTAAMDQINAVLGSSPGMTNAARIAARNMAVAHRTVKTEFLQRQDMTPQQQAAVDAQRKQLSKFSPTDTMSPEAAQEHLATVDTPPGLLQYLLDNNLFTELMNGGHVRVKENKHSAPGYVSDEIIVDSVGLANVIKSPSFYSLFGKDFNKLTDTERLEMINKALGGGVQVELNAEQNAYTHGKDILELTADSDRVAVMHEIFHATERQLTPAELKILQNNKTFQGVMDEVVELYPELDSMGQLMEGLAESSARLRNQEVQSSVLQRIVDKVQMLIEAFTNLVAGLGFRSAAGIRSDIYTGQVAARGPGEPIVGGVAPQFSRFGRTAGAAMEGVRKNSTMLDTLRKGNLGFMDIDYMERDSRSLFDRAAKAMGKNNPFKRYSRAIGRAEAYSRDTVKKTADISARVKELPDAVRTKLYTVMKDATMASIHPDKSLNDVANLHLRGKPVSRGGKLVYPPVKKEVLEKAQQLNAQWRELSPEARGLYVEMKNHLQDGYNDRRKAILNNLVSAEGMFVNNKQLAKLHAIKTAKDVDEFIALDPEKFGHLKETLNSVAKLTQVQGPYFPLRREGEYVVSSADDGEKYVAFHTKKADAAADLEARRAANPDRTYQMGLKLEQDLLGNQDRKTIARLAGTLKDQDTKNRVNEALTKILAERILYGSQLKRQNVEGVKAESMGTAFNEYMQASATAVGDIATGQDISQAMTDMDTIQRTPSTELGVTGDEHIKMGLVNNELKKRNKEMASQRNIGKSEKVLGSLGFFNFLGAPSYWLTNATQTATVSLPNLAARSGQGMAAAFKALSAAYVQTLDIKESGPWGFDDMDAVIAKLAETEPGKARALTELIDTNVIQSTLAEEFRDPLAGSKIANWTPARKVIDILQKSPEQIERFNRISTAIAAYDIGLRGDAITDMVQTTQFNYSTANRARLLKTAPEWLGGGSKGLVSPMMMFKVYGVNMARMIYGNALKGVSSSDPKVRKESRQIVGGLLATHTVFGGVSGGLGLGLFKSIEAAVNAVLDDEDEVDMEASIQGLIDEYVTANTGEYIGRIASQGIGAAVGIDMSGSIDLGNLLWMSRDSDLSTTGGVAESVLSFMGPLANYGSGVVQTAARTLDGEYDPIEDMDKILGKVIPWKMARGLATSIGETSRGLETRQGNQFMTPEELGLSNIVKSTLGLRSSDKTARQQVFYEERGTNARLEQGRRKVLELGAKADSPGKRRAARDRIKEWNKAMRAQGYPKLRVTWGNVVQSKQRRRDVNRAYARGDYTP